MTVENGSVEQVFIVCQTVKYFCLLNIEVSNFLPSPPVPSMSVVECVGKLT